MTTQDKINKQIKTEELESNPNFNDHRKYDMSLNCKLQKYTNFYRLVLYNPQFLLGKKTGDR